MKLLLDNVGVIKNSEVKLDGLTVITGKNSSGKTTVGKVVYSLISASSNPNEAFEKARKAYICSRLVNIERVMQIRRIRGVFYGSNKKDNELGFVMNVLATRKFRVFDIERLTKFLYTTKNLLEELTLERYNEYLTDSYEKNNEEFNNSFFKAINESFDELRSKALDICQITIEVINDDKLFINFLKDRTNAYLNHEFNKQIKPIRNKKQVSIIELSEQNKCIVNAKVRKESNVEFLDNSSFVYPYSRCIFIDNPFVIDHLEDDELDDYIFREYKETNDDAMIKSEDIENHDSILINLLNSIENKNYFNDVEIQKKYKKVFEKINKIVPGEFEKTKDGFFYVENGSKLAIKNLATGSKTFFIIKKLLMNGLIDNETMLILDEPESHLHPEWINRFAEILVVLIEELKVNILITTHSPNLMLALNVYSKEMSISDKSHFYLAEKMEDGYYSQIRCIDNSIGEGYSHLSLPLVEMNLEMEKIEGD